MTPADNNHSSTSTGSFASEHATLDALLGGAILLSFLILFVGGLNWIFEGTYAVESIFAAGLAGVLLLLRRFCVDRNLRAIRGIFVTIIELAGVALVYRDATALGGMYLLAAATALVVTLFGARVALALVLINFPIHLLLSTRSTGGFDVFTAGPSDALPTSVFFLIALMGVVFFTQTIAHTLPTALHAAKEDALRKGNLQAAIAKMTTRLQLALTEHDVYKFLAEELQALNYRCAVFQADRRETQFSLCFFGFPKEYILAAEALLGKSSKNFRLRNDSHHIIRRVINEKTVSIVAGDYAAEHAKSPELKTALLGALNILGVDKVILAYFQPKESPARIVAISGPRLQKDLMPIIRDFVSQVAPALDNVEMKRKLRARTAELERMAVIISDSNDAIIVFDRDNKVRSWNRAAEILYGFGEDEMLGRNYLEVVCEKDRQRVEQWIDDVRADKNSDTLDFGRLTNKGVILDVWASGSVLYDDFGVPVSVAVTERDITERKMVEKALRHQRAELQRSNLELQQFASVTSHDLQEPLRKITTFSSMLLTGTNDIKPEMMRRGLERIHDGATRMRTLIVDLLELSRITSQAKSFQHVDLNKTVNRLLGDFESRISQSHATIDIGDLPTVWAEPTQMHQLFQNLIGNALKYHKPNEAPVVYVICEPRDIQPPAGDGAVSNVEIRVRDNGIGFEQTYADRVFEVFERLHRDQGYEGTGIGLAICRRIVERHGGTIRAESAPGEGTTFVINLPLKPTEQKITELAPHHKIG